MAELRDAAEALWPRIMPGIVPRTVLTRHGAAARDGVMFLGILQVALGGAIGAVLRYLTGVATLRAFGSGFPMGTLVVNVLGSFAMGVLVVALASLGGNRLAPFLMTGLLGGFTTFSAFSLDAVTLYERGQVGAAAGYIVVSVAVSLSALVAGLWSARVVLS